jgi:hypothetical protein
LVGLFGRDDGRVGRVVSNGDEGPSRRCAHAAGREKSCDEGFRNHVVLLDGAWKSKSYAPIIGQKQAKFQGFSAQTRRRSGTAG